jgi:hypothetical protein
LPIGRGAFMSPSGARKVDVSRSDVKLLVGTVYEVSE